MKIKELLENKLFHGSQKKFPVGFVLKPQSDGYVYGDITDAMNDADVKLLESYMEKYRPKNMISRRDAVFMCMSINDIEHAGGYLDYVYEVKPIGNAEKHDLAWHSHLQTFLGGEDTNTPEIQAEIKNAALNYWNGVPFTDRNSSLFEYIAREAKIIRVSEENNDLNEKLLDGAIGSGGTLDDYHRFETAHRAGEKYIWAHVVEENKNKEEKPQRSLKDTLASELRLKKANMKEEIETISYGSDKSKIFVNPSPREAEGLFNNAVKMNLNGRTRSDEGVLRFIANIDGTLFMWDAYDLIHHEVAEYFGVPQDDLGYIDTKNEARKVAREYAEIREKHKVRESIEKVKTKGNIPKTFTVVVNPTPNEAAALYRKCKQTDSEVRYAYDDNYDLYMWDGYDAGYLEVVSYFGIAHQNYEDFGMFGSEKQASDMARQYAEKRSELQSLNEIRI